MEHGTSETRPSSSPPHAVHVLGFAPGTVLAERYRIVALVGRGGMGEVYRADDLRVGQPVALKFLSRPLERDAAARDRLIAEVRNARTVSHPNVCRVYDVGEVQGRYFLTMEYIDGEDLASLLRRIGRLPPGKALEIARQLCAGLGAAHERGVLHGDLKPANVMIDGRGQARITDFGLAAEVQPSGASLKADAILGVVEIAGTIAYMAPERFEGGPATVQSDLYALGLVLYEAYTGKRAVSGTTFETWRRAHSDSTPSHPSTLVAEIEPGVERAILRCLEKDPARRPASAAQLAASLPGGDPLAAAIAAGETPSPELVAASGEEGTLPRWQAWVWLAAVVASFAALWLPGLASWWSLASRVTLQHPELQKGRAQQILRQAGYGEPPIDQSWWMRPNTEYLVHFRDAADRGRALDAAASRSPAVLFCYRQSPAVLSNLSGYVSAEDPTPIAAGDAYLELDAEGRLVELRVVPSRDEAAATPSGRFDWTPLIAAAGIDPIRLTEVGPRWGPANPYDERAAWEGVLEHERVRVEVAARHGKATYFRATPTWMAQPARAGVAGPRAWAFQTWFNAVLIGGAFGFLAVLAVRNLRLGRGDRRSAYRLSAFMFAAITFGMVLSQHWTAQAGLPGTGTDPSPMLPVRGMVNPVHPVLVTLGCSLFAALATWLAYVGFEPYVRRRWPHLLVASTRLLAGRLRDPMVGRSLLAGVLGAIATLFFMFVCEAIVRRLAWGVVVPALAFGTLDGLVSFVGYVARYSSVYVQLAVVYLAVLVLARLLLRSNAAAWVGVTVVSFAMFVGWGRAFLGPYPAVVGVFAATVTAGGVVVFWKSGYLAFTVWFVVIALIRDTPWTPELMRWHAWPTWFTTALIAGLTFWGFRNVLGRQSAFPGGALDQ